MHQSLAQKYLLRGWLYLWVWPRLNLIRRPRHQFQKIEKELKAKPDWPKLGTKDYLTRKLIFANDSN